jgi:hypothetical protein
MRVDSAGKLGRAGARKDEGREEEDVGNDGREDWQKFCKEGEKIDNGGDRKREWELDGNKKETKKGRKWSYRLG